MPFRFPQRQRNEKRFDDLAASIVKELKASNAVLDGEIVAIDESGMPAFYDLMKRKRQVAYFAFDLLWLNGKDLREFPLLERKRILRSIIPLKSPWIGYVSFIDRQASKLFDLVKAKDLEGLVVKRKDGKYGLATRWYKILNPTYSQKINRSELFNSRRARPRG